MALAAFQEQEQHGRLRGIPVNLFPCLHGTLEQEKKRLSGVQERCQKTDQKEIILGFKRDELVDSGNSSWKI